MFVPTRSSLLKKQWGESCETVVFSSRRSERRPQPERETKEKDTNGKPDPKYDLKKLRYDIIKFGSSGFDGTKREESRIALAVALGAKPPKRKGKNYVDVLKEKKAEKEKAEKKQNLVKPLFKKKQVNWRRKDKGGRGLLNSYGKVQQGSKPP